MGDLPKRRYAGTGDRMHADVELAVKRVRDDLVASEIAYTPAGAVGTVWATSAPDDVKEALDRLADYVSTTHAAIPEL